MGTAANGSTIAKIDPKQRTVNVTSSRTRLFYHAGRADSRRMPAVKPLVVLGWVSAEARAKTRKRMTELATRLGEIAQLDVGVTPAKSYEELAGLIHRRAIDFAWLSPIVLVSLARNQHVVPLLALVRDKRASYTCALLVRPSSHISTFEELHGKRAAWVDKHSAAGYVLPRIELAAHGVRGASLDERMVGSHEAVVRAVASGRADFGATYARLDAGGVIVGPWTRTPGLAKSIRVMTTFGDVPPDAIAARYDLDRVLRDRVASSLRAMSKSWTDRELVADVFGASDFEVPKRTAYEALRENVYRAYKRGILDGDIAKDTTLSADATSELAPSDAQVLLLTKRRPAQPKPRSADDTHEDVRRR
jgi:phosphate/phosphite/phosphonate ABC transporter binding protein